MSFELNDEYSVWYTRYIFRQVLLFFDNILTFGLLPIYSYVQKC